MIAHSITSDEVLKALDTNSTSGLTDEKVISLREKHGLNKLEEKKLTKKI